MTIEKMLNKIDEKTNMLVTIATHQFDMLRKDGLQLPPDLDVKNRQEAINYTKDIDRKGLVLELYKRIMAGLV